MFEAAVNARPGEPPLLKELFMCYVRVSGGWSCRETEGGAAPMFEAEVDA